MRTPQYPTTIAADNNNNSVASYTATSPPGTSSSSMPPSSRPCHADHLLPILTTATLRPSPPHPLPVLATATSRPPPPPHPRHGMSGSLCTRASLVWPSIISLFPVCLFFNFNSWVFSINIPCLFSHFYRRRARLQPRSPCFVSHLKPVVCAVNACPLMSRKLESAWICEGQ